MVSSVIGASAVGCLAFCVMNEVLEWVVQIMPLSMMCAMLSPLVREGVAECFSIWSTELT